MFAAQLQHSPSSVHKQLPRSRVFYCEVILCARLCIAQQNRSIGVNVVYEGSPSRIFKVLLISLGITILPKSSTRRTIPVAFIYLSPLQISRRDTVYGGVPTLILQITLLVSVKQGDLYAKNPMIDFPQMQRYN